MLLLNHTDASGGVENIIPKPRQAYDRLVYSGLFPINPYITKIYLNPEKPAYEAAFELNKIMKTAFPDTLEYAFIGENDTLLPNGIVLGYNDTRINDLFKYIPDQPVHVDSVFPGPEGYVLDIMPGQVIIAGSDKAGIHYGIVTMLQLVLPGDATNFLMAARVIDAPEFPNRWVHYPMNLLVGSNLDAAKSIWGTAANFKLNGMEISDVKYEFMHDMPQRYVDSLLSAKKFLDERYIKFIPGVAPFGYSNSTLYNNPNLASGLPVWNQRFAIEGGIAKIVPEVEVSIPNGGFENHNGNNFTGFTFIDEPGTVSFADLQTKYSGNTSLRLQNYSKPSGASGNARVCFGIPVKPFTQYHVSFMVKTENVQGYINFMVLGDFNKSLTFYNLGVPSTTDGWQKVDYIFNSLDCDTAGIYWGIWGGDQGTMWLDDLKLEESSFINLIRRPGAPLQAYHQYMDSFLQEGYDFDTLRDEKMGMLYPWPGEYDAWHEPPVFRIKEGGRLKDKDTIFISYYNTTYIYDGQVMISMSEQETYDIFERNLRRLDSLLKPEIYFMNHDEIRVMNWDAGDQNLGFKEMTPAEILAYNVNQCISIIKKYNPDADLWDWSDMFDEFHNAVPGPYYLVNGTLVGSADIIDKSLGMMNWNPDRENSLGFFNGKGFRQMSAPYYDAGLGHIRQWKEDARGTDNFLGMMYTTWQRDYSNLEAFAEYSWNHAPYIYYYPMDKKIEVNPDLGISFHISGDKWDDQWSFASGKVWFMTNGEEMLRSMDYTPETNGNANVKFGVDTNVKSIKFYITATDNRGWTTRIPFGDDNYFTVGDFISSASDEEVQTKIIRSIYPNPVNQDNKIRIEWISRGSGSEVLLKDLLGRELYGTRINSEGTSLQSLDIDMSSYESGVYFIEVRSGGYTETMKVVK